MFNSEISLNRRSLKGKRKEKLGHTIVLTSLHAVPTICTPGTARQTSAQRVLSK